MWRISNHRSVRLGKTKFRRKNYAQEVNKTYFYTLTYETKIFIQEVNVLVEVSWTMLIKLIEDTVPVLENSTGELLGTA